MSGGRYYYAYRRIADFADDLIAYTPLRRAFRDLLRDVAEAARMVEWVDSADCSEGAENEAIRKCFRKLPQDFK